RRGAVACMRRSRVMHLARTLARAGHPCSIGGRRAGHADTADQQALDCLLVLAEVSGVADTYREAVAAFHRLRYGPTPQGDLNGVLDVADAHTVAGRFLAVDLDLQIALAHERLGNDIHRAGDRFEGLLDLLADAL